MSGRIFDFHAHLAATPDAARELLKLMDELGIDRAVVVPGGSVTPEMLAQGISGAKERNVPINNEALLARCADFPERLTPFYFGNPFESPAAYLAAESARGLKLGPAVHGVRLLDPRNQLWIEAALTRRHPIYLHCLGHEGFDVPDFVRLVDRNPQGTFILGHGGVGNADYRAVALIADRANIYFETSGTFSTVARFAIERLGAERVVFGSEHPMQDAAVELLKAKRLRITESSRELYLNGNAGRILGQSLESFASPPVALLERALARARVAPFYRERLRGKTSWADVPLTTKDDLRATYPLGLLAVPRERLATYHESSGTSGEPTATYFTEADWDDIASRFARNGVDLRERDTVLVKTPYSLVTTAHQMHRAARLRGALVIPADNRSSNMPYSKVVRLLKDLAVTVAWCLPSEAFIWAKAARAAGLDPKRDFPTFRAFVVAGEPLSPARKRRMSELWGGVSVFEDYGSTETGSLAGDCPAGNLHAWSDRLYFEVIDPVTHRSQGCGEGWLAVTPLFREGQPLLRYLVGDHVKLGGQRCVCGSSLPVIRVLGRPESAIAIGERSLLPVAIEDAIFSLPEAFGVDFWRARPLGSKLLVEIEGERTEPVALGAIADFLSAKLETKTEVQLAPTGTFLTRETLLETGRFLKPRFVFREGEAWDQGLNYR